MARVQKQCEPLQQILEWFFSPEGSPSRIILNHDRGNFSLIREDDSFPETDFAIGFDCVCSQPVCTAYGILACTVSLN